MFDFSSMGVECDKAAMAVWQALHEPGLGNDLAHEPGLGSELRTGGTLARKQARRWRGHVRTRERRQRGQYVQHYHVCAARSSVKKPLYLFKRVQNFYINKGHHVHERI